MRHGDSLGRLDLVEGWPERISDEHASLEGGGGTTVSLCVCERIGQGPTFKEEGRGEAGKLGLARKGERAAWCRLAPVGSACWLCRGKGQWLGGVSEGAGAHAHSSTHGVCALAKVRAGNHWVKRRRCLDR